MKASERKCGAWTGETRAVLVFGQEANATAVTTRVLARRLPPRGGNPVEFHGPVAWDAAVQEHCLDVIFPIADRLRRLLGLRRRRYGISAVNVGAASGMDAMARIEGMSVGVPLLLAILSAGLQIPLPTDVVSTGHVASGEGDVGWVRDLPAKLAAAIAEPGIRRFVYPDPAGDDSLLALSPEARESALAALATAGQHIDTVPTMDLGQLVDAVFSEEAIVTGGLRSGFYGRKLPARAMEERLGGVASKLIATAREGFWRVLEGQLLAGDAEAGGRLLTGWAKYHIRRRQYSCGSGARLRRLTASLPPSARRQLRSRQCPLSIDICLKLGRWADQRQQDDVVQLLTAADLLRTGGPDRGDKTSLPPCDEHDAVGRVLAAIGREALADRVGNRIDQARASYVMDRVTVQSHREFLAVISAYYVHLRRHLGQLDGAVDVDAAGADARALVSRAFPGEKGVEEAMAEALAPVRGGMRHVLDTMTDRFKREQQEYHVLQVLTEEIDPLDFATRVRFMTGLLGRLRASLPRSVAVGPPERYANHCQDIVRAYVESLDRTRDVLRKL